MEEAEDILRTIRVSALTARLEACRSVCASLASEFARAGHSISESRIIAKRWDALQNDGYVLEFMIDLLKRRLRERRGEPSFEPGPH
jgi:hypothetical protein